MSVKVWFDGASAQYHPGSGRDVKPGVNETDLVGAAALLKAGLVRPATAAEAAAFDRATAEAESRSKAAAVQAENEASAAASSARAAAEALDAEAKRALVPDAVPTPKPATVAAKEKE